MSNARRLLLLAPIMLLGLTIPFFLHLHAKAQGPDDMETFVAPDGSYSFQYPDDWSLLSDFGIVVVGNSETTFLVEGEIEDGHVEIIFIAPEQLNSVIGIESHGSPNAAMDRYIDSTSGGNIISYDDPEGIIVGETVGVRVFVSDFEAEGWVYMIDAGNDTVMMVLVVAPLDEFEEHEEIVSEILDTLRFATINAEATPDIQATVVAANATDSTADEVPLSTPLQFVTPTPIPTIDSQPFLFTATAIAEMVVASPMPSPTVGELPQAGGLIDESTVSVQSISTISAPTLDIQSSRPTSSSITEVGPVIVITIVPLEVEGPDFEATIVALESTIAVFEADATEITGAATSSNFNGCEVVVIQEGDNLFSIAAEFDVTVDDIIVLNDLENGEGFEVGRELLMPSETCLPEAIAAATDMPPIDRTPRPTAISLSQIEITSIEGAGDLSTEFVELYNAGRATNLTGWTLEDEDGHVFEFPQSVIFADSHIAVHSRVGRNRPSELYLNADEAIWQDGEIATLFDADGNVAATYIIGEE